MNAMHDWTLKSVLFEWKLARVTISLEGTNALEALLVADGVVGLHVPQEKPWGPSVSVNEVVGPSDAGNGLQKLSIEMQSGDVMTIVARAFQLPKP